MVYKRNERDAWFVAVPTRHGRVKRSTGTAHKSTAVGMERMLDVLGPKGRRDWDLLERVVDGTLTLGRLYDAYVNNDLETLRARLADADLAEHVPSWLLWLGDRVSADTRAHYEAHLRTLIPEGERFPRLKLTGPVVAKWLATRTGLVQKRRKSTKKPSRRREDRPGRPISGRDQAEVPRRRPKLRHVPRGDRRARQQPAPRRPGASAIEAAGGRDRAGRCAPHR